MNPSNLVLQNLPSETPNINNDVISDINDSDWYTCTYNHYNDILGINFNRVIREIISAIDKTHTDVKGKLCVEGSILHCQYSIWLQEETITVHGVH